MEAFITLSFASENILLVISFAQKFPCEKKRRKTIDIKLTDLT